MGTGSQDPSRILETAMGFWASKTLLSAVELELFTVLDDQRVEGCELAARLGIHERAFLDFFDALVSLGFLRRDGVGPHAIYSNSPQTFSFLNKRSASYLGATLEMLNDRGYRPWGNLTEALRTGQAQSEVKSTGQPYFTALYADERRLEQYMHAMAGAQMSHFIALTQRFNFSRYETFCDIGGASGALAIQVARRFPSIRCATFDLPAVQRVALRSVAAAGLSDRVAVLSGDFFQDPLPFSDVIAMGNILHDWGLSDKISLIQKVYQTLPKRGVFIAIENIIDNERRRNSLGLLMSLNMLIQTPEGFDYTGESFNEWCRGVGFQSTEILPLHGPVSAAIAYK